MSVQERVNNILLDILEIKEKDLVPEAKLRQDLKASSVDLVEVIAALENEFDIDISDAEAAEVRTLGAMYEFVSSKSS